MNKKQVGSINVLNGIKFVLHGKYLGIMFLTTIAMYVFLSISMQVLFLNPLFFNWQMAFGNDMKPEARLFLYIAPVLFGLAFTLMIYRIKELRGNFGRNETLTTGGLFASLFVPGCSVCLTLVLTSIGVSYAIFNSLIAPVIIPIQILVYSLLLISIYFLAKNICVECLVKRKK